MARLRFISLAIGGLSAAASFAAAAPVEAVRDPDPPPKAFITNHDVPVGGKRMRYKAIAAELDVADAHGKPQARIFSTTYLREGVDADKSSGHFRVQWRSRIGFDLAAPGVVRPETRGRAQ